MLDIDKSEFVVESTPSGRGYYAYLPQITTMRGVGGTPEAAKAQLVRMLDPANSARAIMERMPVLSAEGCQFLLELTAANRSSRKGKGTL